MVVTGLFSRNPNYVMDDDTDTVTVTAEWGMTVIIDSCQIFGVYLTVTAGFQMIKFKLFNGYWSII